MGHSWDSWHTQVESRVVELSGYNFVRKDRLEAVHGGIGMYIKNEIKFSELTALSNPVFEVLWVKLNPTRLPRGVDNVIVGTVYHPPSGDNLEMQNYLIETLSAIEANYCNCGMIILGDFNRLCVRRLINNFSLKQIVNFPTRGRNTLDLVLTNLKKFYEEPTKMSAFGLSDHITIEVKAKTIAQVKSTKSIKQLSDLRPSKRYAVRAYLQQVNVSNLIDLVPSCEAKVKMLETIVSIGINSIMPMKSKTVVSNEPPWITSSLKNLIQLRQNALKSRNTVEFNRLRNLVNRERKHCRAKYYEAKVKHLKDCKPSDWWKEVKKLSGMKSASRHGHEVYRSLEIVDGTTENVTTNLANIINESFLSPMNDFMPLSNDFLTRNNINGGAEPVFAVATEDVFV